MQLPKAFCQITFLQNEENCHMKYYMYVHERVTLELLINIPKQQRIKSHK